MQPPGAYSGPVAVRRWANGYARLTVPSAADCAPHRDGNFPTPTGKCEFKSTITGGGNFVVPLFRQGYNGDQDGTPVDP